MNLTKSLWTKLITIGLGATMALGVGLTASKIADNEVQAASQLLNSYNFLDGGSSSNNAYASTDLTTNVSYAADNPGGTSGTTAWEADYANLSLENETRLGGKLVSTVQTNNTTAWANIKTKFTYGKPIEKVEVLGVAAFGTAGNWTNTYLQSSLDSVTWTTQATSTTKTGTIDFGVLLIPTSSYLRLGIALTASTKNSGIGFTGFKVYEKVTAAKTLSSLGFTGTPTTTSYLEGDDFDSTGLTVTATYSDASKDDVTSAVVWDYLTQGDTSVVGTYTYSGSSLTVTITGLTVGAAPVVGGIVDGHAYLITATNGTTTYVLKAGSAFTVGNSDLNTAVFASPANYSLADAYVFTKVATNQYSITSGSNYLSANSTNDGLVLGTTSDSWTATVNTYDYNGIHLQDSNNSRYLTVYAAGPDFRTYTSTSSQGNYAACIVLYDMTVLDGFASDFNSSIGGVCNANGNTNVSTLASEWSESATTFSNLSASQKAVYADTTNALGNESGTTIQKALSRYTYVAAKYNTQLMASGWDFMGRNISPASGTANIDEIAGGNNHTALAVIVISSLIGLSTVAGFYFLRKKKETF